MAAAVRETDRVCPECGNPFKGKGNRVTCGPVCGKARMLGQQADHAAAKHDKGWKPEPIACRECDVLFVPYSSRQVLCTAIACKAASLAKSVQSQRERRAAKRTNDQS